MQADAKSSQPTILVESQICVTRKQTTSEEREKYPCKFESKGTNQNVALKK